MLEIRHHRLFGTDACDRRPAWRPSPNHNEDIVPRFLMFHYTGCSAEMALALLTDGDRANPVSAHLLVDLDGSVTQMVDFNRRAWHAGESSWGGLTALNAYAIGVEVVNAGFLEPDGWGGFICANGSPLPAERLAGVVEARHKHPDVPYTHWDGFTPAQLSTCETLAQLLVNEYGLEEILGHDDVAPVRKVDPGPAFPLGRIRARVLSGR